MEVPVNRVVNYLVNTEGTTLKTTGTYYTVDLAGKTMSRDGILLDSFRRHAGREAQEMPDEPTLAQDAEALAAELLA